MNSLVIDGLVGTNHVLTAAIARKGKLKARSENFHMSTEDLLRFHSAFVLDPSELRLNGLNYQDGYYRLSRADARAIYLKCDAKKSGIIICRTNRDYLVISTYDSSMYASIACEATERLAEYLRGKDK